MAVRRGVRRTPYPVATVLTALVTEDQNWGAFDGWCASQGFNPIELPWRRFLNLVYYWATRGKDQKQLDQFNAELNKATSRWNMEMLRRSAPVRKTEETEPTTRQRRKGLPPPPPWWKDGKEAATQSMLAARELHSLNLSGKR